jgi:hypothetical protein
VWVPFSGRFADGWDKEVHAVVVVEDNCQDEELIGSC